MNELDFLSFKIANFRCFGEKPQGFESIKNINLIIGSNNSGKSSLLEMVRKMYSLDFTVSDRNRGNVSAIRYSIMLSDKFFDEINLEKDFSMHEGHVRDFRENATGYRVNARLAKTGVTSNPDLSPDREHGEVTLQDPYSTWADDILKQIYQRFSSHNYIRLAAERDIVPEEDVTPAEAISLEHVPPSGRGATKVFKRLLNNNDLLLRKYVSHKILPDFNRIIGDRWKVSELPCLLNPWSGMWELHLQYSKDLIVPLSSAGGGIKTILLVLLWIHVVPEVILKTDLSNMIFCLEELENNLHPAVQKRLFKFLRQIAVESGSLFFITTHSHVVIDLFSKDDRAQILHVSHENEYAEVVTVSSHGHHSKVFDDLDVRASDLLQSNCVVWVEGPSDRMYFNRWMELIDPDLMEHVDYEFAFTSGTLISHTTYDPQADENADVSRLIQAIRLNRHAIVLLDRDKDDGTLKDWAERVVKELEASGGLPWVTYGKEVENYIPLDVLKQYTGKDDLEEPERFANIIDLIKKPLGRKTLEKVALAEQICPLITKELVSKTLDLEERVKSASTYIRRWNARPPRL